MNSQRYNLLLADDDTDDCIFFKEALQELPVTASLLTVHDGVELMQLLTTKETTLPDVLFLDLNMPRKTGIECLSEIKNNVKLKDLPIVIYSTSCHTDTVDMLYSIGANYYIRKAAEFSNLKKTIHEVLIRIMQKNISKPGKDTFVVQP